MKLNSEYYNKFPNALKEALLSGIVEFPDSLKRDYDDVEVYRGVKYNSSKKSIDRSDFLSHAELRGNPMIDKHFDENNISSYSCSCYTSIDKIRELAKYPRRNKAIAKGKINKSFGPICMNDETTHIDLYLFDKVDPSSNFEVYEIWKKNGLK